MKTITLKSEPSKNDFNYPAVLNTETGKQWDTLEDYRREHPESNNWRNKPE